jgi:hypothetical protein
MVATHVFFDNSNIYGGAQRAAAGLEPEVPWVAIRLYYRNLFRLIEGAGQVATRILGGSVPPGNEPLWQTARDLGYNTDLLKRVELDDGRMGEQAVDELLHLKIANTLLDHDGENELVIASGDGSLSDFNTSFLTQAERALRRGWTVRVWSWTAQMSSRYGPLAVDYPGRLHLESLDPYYNSVTFVRGGGYRMQGEAVQVRERVVSPLRL